MNTMTTKEIMQRAWKAGTVVPAFNIPYLPMMEPVVEALKDRKCFGLIVVARLEWEKFESKSPQAIYNEYQRVKDEAYTRLHMDHVPVIDEDNTLVNFYDILSEAVDTGYESIMVDGSRLGLQENISATQRVVEMAHRKDIPVEAELGAVMGHEAGPIPPYEELFASGKGFTSPDEAREFVRATGADWLSVAVGNIHGAISAAARGKKKVEAILNIEHLKKINEAVAIPLVLHGGTGIQKSYIMDGIKNGISKINIATAIRQPYEAVKNENVSKAQDAVYKAMLEIIDNDLELGNSAVLLGVRR